MYLNLHCTSWRGWQEKVEAENALERQAQDTATMQKKEAQVPYLLPFPCVCALTLDLERSLRSLLARLLT